MDPSSPACYHPQPHASLLPRSKMPLPPLMLQSLIFGHDYPSSGRHPLLPPLPAAVLSLLLLLAIACLYHSHRWLVVASFPAMSSAARSIVRCSHHWHFLCRPPHHPLIDMCHPLFDCPPSSINSGYPSHHRFKPCIASRPSYSLVWLSIIHHGWLLHCILSHHCLLSAGASACHLATASCCLPWLLVALLPLPFFASPPPIHLGLHLFFFVASSSCHQLLLSPAVEVDWCVVFLSTLAVGKDKYPWQLRWQWWRQWWRQRQQQQWRW